METTEMRKIGEGVYRISYFFLGEAGVSMYLILGRKKALLIDTAYSSTDVPGLIARVCEMPLLVVNTNGRMDHIGGNRYFKKVYLNRPDHELAKRESDPVVIKDLLEQIPEIRKSYKELLKNEAYQRDWDTVLKGFKTKYLDLPEEGCFDLGERTVSIIETPGHTGGSICLFDEESGILFAGDMLDTKCVELNRKESADIETYRDSLLKIKEVCLGQSVHVIYASRHGNPVPMELLDRYLELCDGIIAGKAAGKPVDSISGCCLSADDGIVSLLYREAEQSH